jgi:hypothetical protein
MFVVGTESSQWCHNNSVLQLQVAQLEGLEEVRRHGGYGRRRPTLIGNVELPIFEQRLLNVLRVGGRWRRQQA